MPEALLPKDIRVIGTLEWTPGPFPGEWRTTVVLPDLEPSQLCVPSLLLWDARVLGYQMTFRWNPGGQLALSPIAVLPDSELPHWERGTLADQGPAEAQATGGLDCMVTRTPLADVRLHIDVITEVGEPNCALLIGSRSMRMTPVDRLAVGGPVAVPGLSQMTRDAAIARHICSPTCVAMVLKRQGRDLDVEDFARSCEHPHHRDQFGMWPLNLLRARVHGASAMVRMFDDTEEAAAILRTGIPLVCSIRFERGALGGAPLESSRGHLVILRAMTRDRVLVNDPAAAEDAQVPIWYDRKEFMQAWLGERGVAYVIWNAGHAEGTGP